jgi:thiosulfate dehydrogenase [quinone] large subunit
MTAIKSGVVAVVATVVPALDAGAAGAAAAKKVRRHPVVRVSRLKTGSAYAFEDPFTGAPAYLVEPRVHQFRAFSRICTHAGCTVDFAGDKFLCPCHGSEFSAISGAVLRGPAEAPLARYDVSVQGGMVYVET